MTQKVSWWRGLLSFSVGFAVAVLTPNIVAEFYPVGEFTKSGIAFMSGTCG